MSDARHEAAGSTGEGGRHRFRLGPLLGAGTFGEVYLARMTSLNGIEQDVAVKLLNPRLDPRSQPVSRMRDEGRMLAAVNHPAILQVMDFCHLEARIGLVTEYVPGADLHDCIFGEDPIPPRAALQVIGTVADALVAAHDAKGSDGRALGLVHRDIKPANLRVTPHASVKVLDFGIAKFEDATRETETTERVAIGTPSYMAPEVQSYEVLEALPSRDVFALGCTLYEALVRELYFEGLGPKEIARLCTKEKRFAEWRSLRMPKLARFGPRMIDLVSRMLRFEHTQRPTAREVADTCLEAAEKDTQGETLRAWCRRRRWPEPTDKQGPWSGRELEDAGLATRQPVRPANATLAPLLDGEGTPAPVGGASPTIVPVGGATLVLSDGGRSAGETVVQLPGGGATVVIVPGGDAERERPARRTNVFDLLLLGVAAVVFAGAVVLWSRPDLMPLFLSGDFGAVARQVVGGGGVTSLDAASEAPADGGGPLLLPGVDDPHRAAEVYVPFRSAPVELEHAGGTTRLEPGATAYAAPGRLVAHAGSGAAPNTAAAGERWTVVCAGEACTWGPTQ